MISDAQVLAGLGFFAGLSVGLVLTVGVMVWLIKSLQASALRETISDILEDVMPGGSEDADSEEAEAEDETHEEWWKKES